MKERTKKALSYIGCAIGGLALGIGLLCGLSMCATRNKSTAEEVNTILATTGAPKKILNGWNQYTYVWYDAPTDSETYAYAPFDSLPVLEPNEVDFFDWETMADTAEGWEMEETISIVPSTSGDTTDYYFNLYVAEYETDTPQTTITELDESLWVLSGSKLTTQDISSFAGNGFPWNLMKIELWEEPETTESVITIDEDYYPSPWLNGSLDQTTGGILVDSVESYGTITLNFYKATFGDFEADRVYVYFTTCLNQKVYNGTDVLTLSSDVYSYELLPTMIVAVNTETDEDRLLMAMSTYGDSTSATTCWDISNGMRWLDDNYRNVVVYDDGETYSFASTFSSTSVYNASIKDADTATKALALAFSGDSGKYLSLTTIGTANSNVLTLLGSAFEPVASFMAMQIFPGITLGTLMLVPLMVAIIVAVVKMLTA